MTDYTRGVAVAFEEEFGHRPKWADTPLSVDVRIAGIDALPKTDPGTLLSLQKVLGMVMWAHRCSRPDVAFSASVLASRAHCWDSECQTQLERLCGLLDKTAGHSIAMMRAIAVQHARDGIRANAILPGWIESDMTESLFEYERFVERVLPRVPMRRWGKADDFAGLAVYLAGDASSYHTGDVITIDGGYHSF